MEAVRFVLRDDLWSRIVWANRLIRVTATTVYFCKRLYESRGRGAKAGLKVRR